MCFDWIALERGGKQCGWVILGFDQIAIEREMLMAHVFKLYSVEWPDY